jgi:hypothetical protein
MPPTPRKTPKVLLAQDEMEAYYGPHQELLGLKGPSRTSSKVSKARLAQLEAMKAAVKPQLMPGAKATLKSNPTLADVTEYPPRLSVKKGQMHVSLGGREAMPLTEAMALVDKAAEKAKASGKQTEVTRLQQVKQKLQGLTQVEAMMRQLPPTEGVMASPAQAARLQRQKKVFELNPNQPSGHFPKKTYAERQSELTPEDARAARLATYLELRDKPTTRIPKELQTALQERFGRGMVTGSQIRKSGLVTTKGAPQPGRGLATRQQYLEDVGGSGYSGAVPSRIENISPPQVSAVLQKGRRLIESLQSLPIKKAAKAFKVLKSEVNQAVKSGAMSREVADSALNRIVEGIMTSGYGDPLLSEISGGRWKKNPISRMMRLANKGR